MNAEKDDLADGRTRFHRFRYHLAKGFVDVGDNVLDLGCGTGYGTEILSEVALHVLGVDLEPSNIACCRDKHSRDNTDFICEDLEKWNIPKCDVAVQFENLEHLYDPKAFVKKLKKKVKKFIIMSVPFGAEHLIEVNGDIQADKDSTHHSVFDTPNKVRELFIDKHWQEYWSIIDGVTFIAIFYKI
jgi:SAM-dependent methyltransferase